MPEPLWTPVGEDCGEEVLAMDAFGEMFVGMLIRSKGMWFCEDDTEDVDDKNVLCNVTQYITTSKLFALSKVKPPEPKPYYRRQTQIKLTQPTDEGLSL